MKLRATKRKSSCSRIRIKKKNCQHKCKKSNLQELQEVFFIRHSMKLQYLLSLIKKNEHENFILLLYDIFQFSLELFINFKLNIELYKFRIRLLLSVILISNLQLELYFLIFLFLLMISSCQEYELKINRNSFKSKKQQHIQLNSKKQKQNPVKKQKLIISLTPKLLSFYSLKKDRQHNRTNQNQIQSSSKNIFKFSKTKNHTLSTNQQNISSQQSQTINPVTYSRSHTEGYESCMVNPQQGDSIKRKQTVKQNLKKGLIKRQQKQIKLKSSSKTISIFKTQRTKQISCPKQLREMSSESIMRFLKKKQKKLREEDNRTVNRLLGNICQTMQYGLNPNFKVFKSQLNFTFGKSRSIEKC